MTYSVDGQLLYRRGLNDAFIAPYLSFGFFACGVRSKLYSD